MKEACVQIKEADGNTSFQPLINVPVDPNLTVYEDVDQILLSQNKFSQGARQKLEVVDAVASEENFSQESEQNEGDEKSPQPFVLLDPEDVSRTLSELPDNREIEEPNCSAIVENQVKICLRVFLMSRGSKF